MLYIQVTKYTKGGSHAVACFATSPKAFKAAVDMSRRKGTVVAVGLPAGDTSIKSTVTPMVAIVYTSSHLYH